MTIGLRKTAVLFMRELQLSIHMCRYYCEHNEHMDMHNYVSSCSRLNVFNHEAMKAVATVYVFDNSRR